VRELQQKAAKVEEDIERAKAEEEAKAAARAREIEEESKLVRQ
jgi:uncharacterized small protein (DUF1192 family)